MMHRHELAAELHEVGNDSVQQKLGVLGMGEQVIPKLQPLLTVRNK
jgi:hypothetical protein